MNFVVVDNFLLRSEIETIQNEVKLAKENGLLSINGIVGGGRTGKDVSFENPEIRSDILGYFDGTEENWPSTRILPRVLDKMNTLICELRDFKLPNSTENMIPELSSISTRSRAMVTCYQGNGSHYNKHCDNPLKNGRKLTCILYLNQEWNESHGGQLKIFHNYEEENYTLINPIANRLLVFWSDMRCLHEVLPAYQNRYAITLWFIDSNERNERNRIEQLQQQQQIEQQQLKESEEKKSNDNTTLPCLTLISKQSQNDNDNDNDAFSCEYQIQYPNKNGFQMTELYVSESEIKLISKDNSFQEFHLTPSKNIQTDKTTAKFHRKTSSLTLTVFYR